MGVSIEVQPYSTPFGNVTNKHKYIHLGIFLLSMTNWATHLKLFSGFQSIRVAYGLVYSFGHQEVSTSVRLWPT